MPAEGAGAGASAPRAAAAPRRRVKVPRYDEFGNYLGDVDPEAEAAAARQAEAAAAAATAAAAAPRDAPQRALPRIGDAQGGAASAARKRSVQDEGVVLPRPKRPAPTGPVLRCDVDVTLFEPARCSYTTTSELELMLHRADRHLIYPPGGVEELRRRDPMYVAQERERAARQRRGMHTGSDGPADATISGLNIRLDTPELTAEWIKQRRKRFPTAQVVEQKRLEAQRRGHAGSGAPAPVGGDKPEPSGTASAEPRAEPERGAGPDEGSGSDTDSDESSETDSDSDSPDEESVSGSSSDMDPERDAISSKAPPPQEPARSANVCRFWLQGRCGFGDACRQRHATGGTPSAAGADAKAGALRRRPQPRTAPPNPYEPPDLLRQLLQPEIGQHVDALAQLIRFVLDNGMLENVERAPGLAEEQQRRRQRIVPLGGEAADDGRVDGGGAADEPPSRAALTRPASPALRALPELVWPPEPDPLVYLDPLRRNDPKPLRLEELQALATDDKLRDILVPRTSVRPYGEVNGALLAALRSWDALPSERHQHAALELVLGVSAQSPVHAHEAYAPHAPRRRAASRPGGGRAISETELFRLGLRIGPNEVRLLQHMAERVSAVTAGPEFLL